MNSPRLGFYVISIGIILQVFGLAGGSWMGNGDQAGDVAFSGPSYLLLIAGMGVVVLGTAIGMFSLSSTLTPQNGDAPRLLPLAPLVILATVSVGTGAFAYQASNTGSGTASASTSSETPPLVAYEPDLTDCPDGFLWHDVMEHCMTPEQIAAYDAVLSQSGDTPPVADPICPAGYSWSDQVRRCVSSSGAPSSSEPLVPSCPSGYFWHDVMEHCMAEAFQDPGAVDCPDGYAFDPDLFYCVPSGPGPTGTPPPNATPVCPTGTYWHPAMNHCMPTEDSCPIGWDYNAETGYCQPPPTAPPTPAPTPTITPTPRPGETPTATPTAPPNATTTPTPGPTPVCPAGYFWHPSMGHCMSMTCPPPLVFDFDLLACVMPGSSTPTPTPVPPTPTPTPEPTPSCPAGYFWHPSMGHCMSMTCPPPLVFNFDLLICEMPGG